MGGDPQEKLDYLRTRLLSSEAGRLYKSASRVVFGEGCPTAALMIVGEAPGAEEDATGRPFVGRSGHLLDKVLARVGVPRDDVYIANVIKRRPPGNRDPEPEEIRVSLPWLHAQIAIIRPRALLAVGRFSGNALAGTNGLPIGALRERHDLLYQNTKTGITIPLVATYHPAYILRSLEYGPKELEKFVRDVKRSVRLSRDEVQVRHSAA